MINKLLLTAAFASVIFTAPAFADDLNASQKVEKLEAARDINQQERILLGLDSWNLTTGEAAKLEKGEARIDAVEAKDDAKGMTDKEAAHIQEMQDKESARIHDLKHNDTYGNRNAPSSERMQEDVKRDRVEEFRMYQAIDVDHADSKQVAKMEAGEAHIAQLEQKAGEDDFVTKSEQKHIQKAEDHESKLIHRVRHQGTHKK